MGNGSQRLRIGPRIGLLIGSLAVVIPACSSAPADDGNVRVAMNGPLTNSFAKSALRGEVPRDLLVAVAQVEGGLSMPARRENLDVDTDVPVAGPLQLRRGRLDTLARASRLTNVSELELRVDTDLALEAGALVLSELGGKTGAKHDDLASWAGAIEEMSGFADDPHRERYVHRVFATLARGGSFEGRDGETIELPAHHELPPTLTIDVSVELKALATAQYDGAEWLPTSCTNKCTPGRAGAAVQYIVIHDTEGGWNASVATLQNDPGKSVQYIIDTDGRVGQFVTEETTAWHAGNFYYNQRSVGIEHVGYATKPYPEAQYAASAKLVDHLATKYDVKRDRAHIIGHDQIPNGDKIDGTSAPCSTSPKECEANTSYGGASHHHDPGIWEWAVYMERISGTAKCNDVTELWNCSNDKTHAFRCSSDKVEVEACGGGCEQMSNGVDDVCTLQPKSAPPPEAPAAPSDPGDGKKSATVTDSADAGCTTSSHGGTSGSPSSPALALLLAAAVGTLVRRRRD